VVKALLRYFSFLYHGVLAIFLLAVSGLALGAGGRSLRLDMLPWTGATLTYVTLFGSLLGLAAVALAILRKVRPLFFVWSLAVIILLVKGYVFSGYYFEPGGVTRAALLILGSFAAAAGAWFQISASDSLAKRY
jgi:hypothetical protein